MTKLEACFEGLARCAVRLGSSPSAALPCFLGDRAKSSSFLVVRVSMGRCNLASAKRGGDAKTSDDFITWWPWPRKYPISKFIQSTRAYSHAESKNRITPTLLNVTERIPSYAGASSWDHVVRGHVPDPRFRPRAPLRKRIRTARKSDLDRFELTAHQLLPEHWHDLRNAATVNSLGVG